MQEQSPEEAGGWCVCVLVSNPDPLHLCPKLCVCPCVLKYFRKVLQMSLALINFRPGSHSTGLYRTHSKLHIPFKYKLTLYLC